VKSLVLRLIAAAAATAVAISGCDAVMPGALDRQTTPATATGVGPGVTADTVKVVFVGVDLQRTSQLTGFRSVDAGDPQAQVKALETWVNANGGIAGRRMQAVFRNYEASNDSPAAEEKLCNQVTQDDQAFAVVLTGQFQSNARPCYAQRRTLMLDATLVATDRQTYEQLAPYLWAASYPAYDEFVTAFLHTLSDRRFFTGSVGVVAADTPSNRAVFDKVVAPYLREAKVTPNVAWIDTTDLGTLNAGLNQSAISFRSKAIGQVMFLGGARMASFFLTAAAAQDFTARYAISSFDNPSFLVNNPATIPQAALKDMIGIGFNPSQDVPDTKYAFPATDAERACVAIFTAAGQTFKTRENARVALTYCDAALLLHAGARNLGADLNATAWAAAARSLGRGFRPSTGFSGLLGAGRFSAANGYRVLGYDQGCGCFAYLSEEESFGNG
jgi:hypothetical protein